MSERILGCARLLFAHRGFDGTSVQDVADAVGITKPSVLYHFSSKEELRGAVLQDLLEHWNATLPAWLAASTEEDQFDRVIAELVGFFADDANRARLLVREILDRPGDVREIMAQKVLPWIEIVAKAIRRGQERCEIRADVDSVAYTVQIINMVVSSMAIHDCLGLVADTRQRRELVRIARTSLFRGGT